MAVQPSRQPAEEMTRAAKPKPPENPAPTPEVPASASQDLDPPQKLPDFLTLAHEVIAAYTRSLDPKINILMGRIYGQIGLNDWADVELVVGDIMDEIQKITAKAFGDDYNWSESNKDLKRAH